MTTETAEPAEPAGPHSELIDYVWVSRPGRYWEAQTIVRHPSGATVRLRVHRNFYPHQSHAVAQMWTATGWATIAHRDPALWAGDAPGVGTNDDPAARRCASHIQDQLLRLADAILHNPTTATTPQEGQPRRAPEE
jgi:hypothetical protein